MWLWGLFLALAGAALIVRRRGRNFEAAVLLFFAVCTGVLGFTIFYACYAWAPASMGLGAPNVSALSFTTLMCLSQDAFSKATGWTVAVVSCSGALGLVAWGRSRGKAAALRACSYVGAALLLLVAGADGFGAFFVFSWCLTSRLF
jgi:hypothetical protein